MSWGLKLWYGSSYVDLDAGWGYDRAQEAIRDSYRAPGGTFHKWDHGFFTSLEIPCAFMPAAGAAVINSWWQSSALCRLEISSGAASEVWSVQIVNDASPFDQRNKPHIDRFKGTVELSTY